MPELFQTFGLLNQYRQGYTCRELQRAAVSIRDGQTFQRILNDDEFQRELNDTVKDGMAIDRERMSALLSKAQQLQARLQTVYRSMLERTLSANSTDESLEAEKTDDWSLSTWRIAGADLALNYSRAANPDVRANVPEPDRFATRSDALGRLDFYRPGLGGTAYEERAGYFTAVSYLYDWDLHQIHTTYATGSDPDLALVDPTADRKLEVVAVDPNRQASRQWRAGDLIPLNVADIFTPEFLASSMGQHLAGIRYVNGSGYQFDVNVPLYAYVREVDYLPDGVTKPRLIDILAGPDLTDADGDEVPDNVVMLDDYLMGISYQSADMTLRDDGDMTATQVNGWVPDAGQVYHFDDDPVGAAFNGGVGFDHSVWAGTHWPGSGWAGTDFSSDAQWLDDDAGFTKTIAMPDIPLMHPSLNYQLPWNVRIDDYGHLSWFNGQSWTTMVDDTTGGAGTGTAGPLTLASMGMASGDWAFRIDGYNRKAQNADGLPFGTPAYEVSPGVWDHEGRWGNAWRDGAAGLEIDDGALLVKTLRQESAPGANDGDQNLKGAARFYVDPKGNIYDLFGYGNGSPDDYDYIPDVDTNREMNLIGNVFGDRQRLASVGYLDPTQDGRFTGTEAAPLLQFSARNYDRPDTPIDLPATGQAGPYDAVAQDPATQTLASFNPGFAGTYLGFVEKRDLTVGAAAVDVDIYNRSRNQLTFMPFRTGQSVGQSLPADGQYLIDRSYQRVEPGSTVVIRDGTGRIIDQHASISTIGTSGLCTVVPSAGTTLKPGIDYTVSLPGDPAARTGGSRDNSLTNVLANILATGEYRDVLKAGLLDDIMLSASATDPFGGMLSGKLTVTWNKRQERLELYQNAFAAIYRSANDRPPT